MRNSVYSSPSFVGKFLKNKSLLLILILVISFLLRLGFSFWANFHTSFGSEWDTDGYGLIANNLLEGNGYVFEKGGDIVLIRGPVYPVSLLLIQLVFGYGVSYKIAVLFMHSVFGSLLCLLTYLIAERIFDQKAGLLSALAVSLHPLLIWYSGRIFVIPLFALLLAISIWLLLKAFEMPTIKRYFWAGIVLGISTLTYSMLLLFPLFVIVSMWAYAFYQRRIWGRSSYTLRSGLKMASIMILGTVLMLAPWTVRNYMVSNELVLVTTGAGYNFLMGNYFVKYYQESRDNKFLMSKADEEIEEILAKKGYPRPGLFNFTASQDKYLNQVALESIKTDPKAFLKKTAKQFFPFWYLGASEKKTRVLSFLQLPILLMAGWGILFSYKRRKNIVLLVLPIIYFNLIYATIHAQVKYSVPVVPYVLILAVYAISELLSYFSKRHSETNLDDKLAPQPKNEVTRELREKLVV